MKLGIELVPPVTRRTAAVDLSIITLIVVGFQYYLGPLVYRSKLLRPLSDLQAWLVDSTVELAIILAASAALLRWRELKWRSVGVFHQAMERQVLLAVLCALVANAAVVIQAVIIYLAQESAPILLWRQQVASQQLEELGGAPRADHQ